MFLFDSTPFRDLAILANNHLADRNDLKYVWDENVYSWLSILDFVSKLQPHDIENTLSIQKARLSIVSTLLPMVQIEKLIKENVSKIETCISETLKKKKKADILTISGKIMTYAMRPWPQLVCNNEKCIKVDDNVVVSHKRVIDRKICHSPCFEGLIRVTYPNKEKLRFCTRFNQPIQEVPDLIMCEECGHDIKDHEWKRYNQKVNIKEDMFKGTIEQLQLKVKSLMNESRVICKSVAKMTSFVNNNVLVKEKKALPEKRRKPKKQSNVGTLGDLGHLLEEIPPDVSDNDEVLSPADVDITLEELFKLEETGENIKTVYDLIKTGEKQQFKKNDRNRKELNLTEIPFVVINDKKNAAKAVEN